MTSKHFRFPRKKAIPLIIGFLILLLSSFQNCQNNIGSNGFDPNGGGSSTAAGSGTTNGSSNTTGTTPSITPTPVVDCPTSEQGTPVLSALFQDTGSTPMGTIPAIVQSGYTSEAGNVGGTPTARLQVAEKNLGASCLKQNGNFRCELLSISEVKGLLWGTTTAASLTQKNVADVTDCRNLSTDTAVGRFQVTMKNVMPTDNKNFICLEGSATYRITYTNGYMKTDSDTFNVNFTNNCTTEKKFDAAEETSRLGAFGEVVSIDGNRAAAMNPGYDYDLIKSDGVIDNDNFGSVRIYERASSTAPWLPITSIKVDASFLEKDKKMISMTLKGNNLFIGYPYLNASSGKVFLYQRDVTGAWTLSDTLNGPTGSAFGSALAFNGTYLVVGAPEDDSLNASLIVEGAVYFYTLTGPQLSRTNPTFPGLAGISRYSGFGASLAMDSGRLVIGAPGNLSDPSATVGNVFVCDVAELSTRTTPPSCASSIVLTAITGTQRRTWESKTIPLSSRIGASVALKDNWILLSAPDYYDYSPDMTLAPDIDKRKGLVALVDLSKASTDAAHTVIKYGNQGDRLGMSLGFGATSFFVGAPGALTQRGYVEQFQLNSTFTQRFRYWGLQQGTLDQFGAALAVSGDTLMVGAPLDDELNFTDSGSISLIKIKNP